jgi:hypothetical protein
MTFLIAAAARAATSPTTEPWIHSIQVPAHWPGQMDLLQWSQKMGPGMATLLIMLGVIYLLFGFYLFKGLVIANAAIAGALFGAAVGHRSGSEVPCAVLGAFVAAAVAVPMMKWAVAVHGGLLGAILGGAIWRMSGLDPQFAWSGALTGLVAFGMFCFILFRGSVMTYMSLQGSLMLVFGILGLLYKYNDLGPRITTGLQARNFILPMAVFIPAVIGLLYQHANNKAAAVPGGVGAPPKK